MRRLVVLLAIALLALLVPAGCGADSARDDLLELLARRSGEVETISYTCATEDAGRLYREEFELGFPDHYRYRLYQYESGMARLRNFTAQAGTDLYRARVIQDPGDGSDHLQVETFAGVPPLRCTGNYLALYHLVGNADFFQSMISLIRGGQLEVTGEEDVEGTRTYRLDSAPGLTPSMRIWLDAATGLPLRKEISLSEDRAVAFRYEDYVENAVYPDEPFPSDPLPLFGGPAMSVDVVTRDGACRATDIAGASAEAGFEPLMPRIDGFGLAAVYVRDPAASNLSGSEELTKFPEGFRELYLVLRNGTRQVEIRETPYSEDFSYYTTSMGALSGAYLTGQETFGEDAANATYTAAMDCQEMRLVLGETELVVTGDLSREEFESLAVQLKELSRSSP
ncbi:MAG: hypothetical protein AB1384_12900 [Actinomycetota bacterium]